MASIRVSFVPSEPAERLPVLIDALNRRGLIAEIRPSPGLAEGLAWLTKEPPDILVLEAGPGARLVLAAHALANRPCPILLIANRSIGNPWLMRADRLVTHSHAIAAEIISLSPMTRVDLIPLPVISDDFAQRMSKPAHHCWLDRWTIPVVLACGMVRRDDHDDFATLLRAASRIGVRVIILDENDGKDGAAHRHLRQLARALDVRLDLLDHIADPLPFLARAPVFVSTATGKALPPALVEAMACGCPVIAQKALGIAEVLEDGRIAPIVPLGDDRALASALGTLLAHPPDPERLVRKAACHSVEAGAEAYARVLAEMTSLISQ